MSPPVPQLEAVTARIVTTALAQPPTLGAGRLVCVDGPAGSGKTTLARALVRGFRDALGDARTPADPGRVRVLHMDDVFAGWTGLAEGMASVSSSVVAPLRTGGPGAYRRYDWHSMAFAEERVVPPCRVLLIEGVGSGAAAYDDAITCLVWVDTPADVRLSRGLGRDGEQMREHWLAWRTLEDAMFERERTRERADVVVDGTGGPTS